MKRQPLSMSGGLVVLCTVSVLHFAAGSSMFCPARSLCSPSGLIHQSFLSRSSYQTYLNYMQQEQKNPFHLTLHQNFVDTRGILDAKDFFEQAKK